MSYEYTEQQIQDAWGIIKEGEAERNFNVTSKCEVKDRCIHVDAKHMAEALTEMEVVMMINTFDFLSAQVKERLLSETKYNEGSFIALKEKQSFIDKYIEWLP